MSWHLVAGVPLPDPVGGHVALDFCNTRAGWGSATPKEYLTAPGLLALWAADAGLLPDTAPLPDAALLADRADEVLDRALALREALYRCALGTGAGSDWSVVAAEVARSRSAGALVPVAGGRPARWAWTGASDETALHAVADAAERLLTSSAPVAACPGAGCGWLFTDPRRRRRWCSMAVCGNRAKARRHAERRTPGATAAGA